MPTFYGVFSQEHFHPVTGQNLRYHYVDFEAQDEKAAHALMRETFGRGWRDTKTTKPIPLPAHPKVAEWVKASGATFMDGAGDAPYVRLPMPSTERQRPGETVTLRVQLTEAMAKENALFIAGRCVAHRPAPNHPVEHGAGVWFEENCWPKGWDAARAFSIGGEGTVVLVRYVPKAAAEGAAAASPENVSIVPGTTFRAWLGVEPESRNWGCEVSGCFTSTLASAMRSPEYQTLFEALIATENARSVPADEGEETEILYEIRGGQVMGTRTLAESVDLAAARREICGLFDEQGLSRWQQEGAPFEDLLKEAQRCEARVAEIKSWRDRLVGFEVDAGQVVGVRMASR